MNGGTNKNAAAAPKKVVNPYAKKSKKATSSNTPNGTTANHSTKNVPSASASVSLSLQQYSSSRQNNLHTIADPGASFSQTFGSPVREQSQLQSKSQSKPQQGERRRNAVAPSSSSATSSGASSTTNINNTNTNASRNSLDKDIQVSRTNAAVASHETNPTLLQPHVLIVSTKQRGNGILRYIRNVPFAYAKIVPDYIVGPNRCALFLSFKYHNLHPNYVHRRIAELRSDFDLRILLCLVDVEDNASILLFLNKLCCVNNMTLVLAWSEQETARYLETFKAFEAKDAATIQKKKEVTFKEQIADTLGCIRSVNKTDSATLYTQFGNLRKVMTAGMDDIRLCPGVGEKKARRMYEAFHKPFSTAMAAKRRKEMKIKMEALKEKEELAQAKATVNSDLIEIHDDDDDDIDDYVDADEVEIHFDRLS